MSVESENPENGINTKKVTGAKCSTKNCLLTPEYGDQCTHCRNVPREAPAKPANYKIVALMAVIGAMAFVTVVVVWAAR